jgi:hypothetical protein
MKTFSSLSRYFYAPYLVWKRYGIKGPTPMPFFGNYRQESKMVLWPILNYSLTKLDYDQLSHALILQGVVKFFEHLQDKYGSVVGYVTSNINPVTVMIKL